jgi:hypothetical protein
MQDLESWVAELDANSHGLRILTLPKAIEMAAHGAFAGWYISPFALKWTVGRMANDQRRYHVIENGEPVMFDSIAEASNFLARDLGLPSIPAVHIGHPQSPRPLASRGAEARPARA